MEWTLARVRGHQRAQCILPQRQLRPEFVWEPTQQETTTGTTHILLVQARNTNNQAVPHAVLRHQADFLQAHLLRAGVSGRIGESDAALIDGAVLRGSPPVLSIILDV